MKSKLNKTVILLLLITILIFPILNLIFYDMENNFSNYKEISNDSPIINEASSKLFEEKYYFSSTNMSLYTCARWASDKGYPDPNFLGIANRSMPNIPDNGQYLKGLAELGYVPHGLGGHGDQFLGLEVFNFTFDNDLTNANDSVDFHIYSHNNAYSYDYPITIHIYINYIHIGQTTLAGQSSQKLINFTISKSILNQTDNNLFFTYEENPPESAGGCVSYIDWFSFELLIEDVSSIVIDHSQYRDVNATCLDGVDGIKIDVYISNEHEIDQVFLMENSTGSFQNRSMSLDGSKYAYTVDVSSLDASNTLYYAFFAENNYSSWEKDDNDEDYYEIIGNPLIQFIDDFIIDLDPFSRALVQVVLDYLIDIYGGQLQQLIQTHTLTFVDREFDLSNLKCLKSLGISFKLNFRVNLGYNDNKFYFDLQISAAAGLDISKWNFNGPLKFISKAISVIKDQYGVDVTLDILGSARILISVDATSYQWAIEELSVSLNPKLTFSKEFLKPLLKIIHPTLGMAADFVHNLLLGLNPNGGGLYGVITTELEFDLIISCHYTPESGIIAFVSFQPSLTLNFRVLSQIFEFKINGEIKIEYSSFHKTIEISGQADLSYHIPIANPWVPMVGSMTFLGPYSQIIYISSMSGGLGILATVNDTDFDYLNDTYENSIGTNIYEPDSDSDGLWDYVEVQAESNPLINDTDADNLTDYDEYDLYYTNLSSNDTDTDNLTDWEELMVFGTSPLFIDTDADNLTDWEEIVVFGTNATQNDTDGDGFYDGYEIKWYSTLPNDNSSIPTDTDGDGLYDSDELKFLNSNPAVDDSIDSDGDGLSNGAETIFINSNPNKKDTDGDGLTDGQEALIYNTNPSNVDSDGDGFWDSFEILLNFDPLDASDNPFLLLLIITVSIIGVSAGIFGVFIYRWKRKKNT